MALAEMLFILGALPLAVSFTQLLAVPLCDMGRLIPFMVPVCCVLQPASGIAVVLKAVLCSSSLLTTLLYPAFD